MFSVKTHIQNELKDSYIQNLLPVRSPDQLLTRKPYTKQLNYFIHLSSETIVNHLRLP